MKSKAELRKEYIKVRQGTMNKAEKSMLICKKISELDEYKSAKTVFLYKSLPQEVNVDGLIETALLSGKTVALPKTFDDFSLKFYKFTGEPLIKSGFGVYEPVGAPESEIETPDIVILPGICFDLEGNRIGFGKGCYDRFLSGKSVFVAAACFESQLLKNGLIDAESTDIGANVIVTERKIYRVGEAYGGQHF